MANRSSIYQTAKSNQGGGLLPPAFGPDPGAGQPWNYPNFGSAVPNAPGYAPTVTTPSGSPIPSYGSGSPFEQGLPPLRTAITMEDLLMDPGYQWKQGQIKRNLEDVFAAKGRTDSTDYYNTLSNQLNQLASNEYNRVNEQQFARNLTLNDLLYNRGRGEEQTAYGRYRDTIGDVRYQDETDFERALRLAGLGLQASSPQTELGFGNTLTDLLSRMALASSGYGVSQGAVTGGMWGSLSDTGLSLLDLLLRGQTGSGAQTGLTAPGFGIAPDQYSGIPGSGAGVGYIPSLSQPIGYMPWDNPPYRGYGG